MCVFNFFDEIKKKAEGVNLKEFNLVNLSGNILYVEGHNGLTVITPQMIAFKIKNGRVVVEGESLLLSELTDNTMIIKGKIVKTEQF